MSKEFKKFNVIGLFFVLLLYFAAYSNIFGEKLNFLILNYLLLFWLGFIIILEASVKKTSLGKFLCLVGGTLVILSLLLKNGSSPYSKYYIALVLIGCALGVGSLFLKSEKTVSR